MKTKHETEFGLPEVVSQVEWRQALDSLLVKEKAATLRADALAAERRRLPMVPVDKNYVFTGPAGKMSLRDLFDGRRQLIIYHFMFAPGVNGWPTAGCPGCSWVVDQIGHLAVTARGTLLCASSRVRRWRTSAIPEAHGMERALGLVGRQRL